jgi:hypothetical protein
MKKVLAVVVIGLLCSCKQPIVVQQPKDISTIVAENQGKAVKNALDTITIAKKLVRDGDLVCRTGFDMQSKALQNFNNLDKSYSHSGLAFIEDGKIFVYHSIAGSDENPGDNFKREPFDSFVNPVMKSAFGIFRYDLSESETACMKERFQYMYTSHMKFDKYFNLKDDTAQYCSEAIAKSLLKCTNGRVRIPTTIKRNHIPKEAYLSNPAQKIFEYIALDNLYLNAYCKKIVSAKFKTNPPLK